MKGFVKMIIVGAVILGIGIAVLIVTLGLNGWKFDNFGSSEFEMKSYTSESDVETLDIDFMAGQLEVVFYDGDAVKIDYPENNKYTSEITEQNGKLSIINKKQHWYDWIGYGCNVTFPTTTISLPQGTRVNLDLHMNAGTVNVAGGEYGKTEIHVNAGTLDIGEITCKTFDLQLNAGTINTKGVDCSDFKLKMNAGTANLKGLECDDIYTKINAGSANMEVAGRETEYEIDIEKNAGSCNKSNHVGSRHGKRIYGTINAGSLDINFTN